MKTRHLPLACCFLLSAPVFAAGFEGFSIEGADAIQRYNYSGSSLTTAGTAVATSGDASKTGWVGSIGAGYGFKTSDRGFVGIHAAFMPGTTDAADLPVTLASGAAGSPMRMKMGNRWDITVQPGTMTSPTTLFYGKIGVSYPQVKADASDAPKHEGYIVGAGVKSLLGGSANWYGFGELNYSNYGNVVVNGLVSGLNVRSSGKITSSGLTLGLGYSF